MTLRQRGWIKYLATYAALFFGVSAFGHLGFQYVSFGMGAVCASLVQVFLWPALWGDELLPSQEVRQQRIYVVLGVAIALVASMFGQFIATISPHR